MKKKKRFYIRYNLIYNSIKIGWGEEVKAYSKVEAKHYIEEKHRDNKLKIVNIWEMH